MNDGVNQGTSITTDGIAFQYYNPESRTTFRMGLDEGHAPYFYHAINKEDGYMYWPASESDLKEYLDGVES